jgi:hypothetical protein
MPWFITAILSKETLAHRAEKHGIRNEPRSRTFGFYNTYNEAYVACDENRGSMCECLYDYLVMEYIEPGIHPMVHSELWWKWNDATYRWDCLHEEKPQEFMGICNWALG